MNDAHALVLAGQHCLLLPTGALFVPGADLLCVSDLHLGKSERRARRTGVLLPPYETRGTLDRLARDVAQTKPRTVVALGDSFDDLAAEGSLDLVDRAALSALMEGRAWVWIEGNHEGAATSQPGTHAQEARLANLLFRHEAAPDAPPGEVSGHWHPKFAPPGFAPRPCFVTDGKRLVLPAYGLYTGGLDARHPPLRALFGTPALAVLTGPRALPVPLDRPAARRRA